MITMDGWNWLTWLQPKRGGESHLCLLRTIRRIRVGKDLLNVVGGGCMHYVGTVHITMRVTFLHVFPVLQQTLLVCGFLFGSGGVRQACQLRRKPNDVSFIVCHHDFARIASIIVKIGPPQCSSLWVWW